MPIGLCLLSVLATHLAWSGAVSVTVHNKLGAAAEDAVVVFDPLDAAPLAGSAAVVIDQVNKRFVPRVSVVRTGTLVSFPNSDRIRHEVYSFSPAHRFTLKLYSGSPMVQEKFDKTGLVVLGCNIHDTMVAFVAVVDSPYFTKIPPAGTAAMTLPPGRYRMRVWHAKLRTTIDPRVISVDDQPLALALTVDLDPSLEAAAGWPE